MTRLEAEPLNIDPAVPSAIRAKLAKIMAPGPESADEGALLDLYEDVADALHMGKIDFPDHDALLDEIRAAHGTLV
jgi:hypothetical protein